MSFPAIGALLANRYRVDELLGEGSMGRVYRARDTSGGGDVAVKVLKWDPEFDNARLRRFEMREIPTLRRIAHPGIVRYLDHGREGEVAYLVTELLRGQTLDRAAKDFRGQPDRVLLLGIRVASALCEGHRQGVIHRDVKPSNIFLTEEGEPRIVDYGLARWFTPEGAASEAQATISMLTSIGVAAGTYAYMSPEAHHGDQVDRRTDIYSLAVVCYELASGRYPYEGPTVEALCRAKEAGLHPPLQSLLPELSSRAGVALDTVLRTALEPFPHRRFQTMEEFKDALEKARALEGSLPPDASAALLVPPAPTLTERHAATLYGRDEEMSVLEAALERAVAGSGGTMILEGHAGIGKSLLVNEFVRRSHRRGVLCLTDEVPHPGSELGELPAASWLRRAREVFPDLAAVARAIGAPERGTAEEWSAPMERPGTEQSTTEPTKHGTATGPHRMTIQTGDVTTVGRSESALPDLSLTYGTERISRRERLETALSALASKMPLVLLLEDIHRGGVETLRWVADLARFLHRQRIMLLVTRRTDVASSESWESTLQTLLKEQGVGRLALGPIGEDALRRMAEDAHPGLTIPAGVLSQLARRSGGAPRYAMNILHLLKEQGVLRRDSGDWVLDEDAPLPEAPEAKVVLEERLLGLDGNAVETLESAAVLGEKFRVVRLAEVLREDPSPVQQRLDSIGRTRHLVQPQHECYAFDQPMTRDLMLARIPPEHRRELNLRAAESLAASMDEGATAGTTGAVATYFLEAGRPAEAASYAARTGFLLRAQQAHQEAIPWLQRAHSLLEQQIELRGEEGREILRRQLADVEICLAECLYAAARYAEALEGFEASRRLALRLEQDDLQARALLGISRAHIARGEFPQAIRPARDSQKVAKRAGLDIERALALASEAHALSREAEDEVAEACWKEALQLLNPLGCDAELCEVRFRFGNHLFRLERYREAQDLYEEASALIDGERDPRQFAQIRNALAAVTLARGCPSEALPMFEDVASIQSRIGSQRSVAATLHNIAFCHHLLGRLPQAGDIYLRVAALRREMGDEAGLASAQINHAQVLLDQGKLEEALDEASGAVTLKRQIQDLGNLSVFLNTQGEAELEVGRTERAREVFLEIQRDFPKVRLEALKAAAGLAEAEWLAGNDSRAESACQDVAARLDMEMPPLEELAVRHRLLRSFRSRDIGIGRWKPIAARALRYPSQDLLPEARMYQSLIRAFLDEADGDADEARRSLHTALEIADTLGRPEWGWRVQRSLALLEPMGSESQRNALSAALEIIEGQGRMFRQEALRQIYLAHRERAEVARLAARSS